MVSAVVYPISSFLRGGCFYAPTNILLNVGCSGKTVWFFVLFNFVSLSGVLSNLDIKTTIFFFTFLGSTTVQPNGIIWSASASHVMP